METKEKKEGEIIRGDRPGVTAWSLGLREDLARNPSVEPVVLRVAACKVEIREGRDCVWIVVTRNGSGGFALRTAYSPGGLRSFRARESGNAIEIKASGPIGDFSVQLDVPDPEIALIRAKTTLIPAVDVVLPSWPRDLYVLGAHDDPLTAEGVIHAEQRGLTGGLMFFTVREPDFGSVMYAQNLTALNGYFRVTGTKPESCIGGVWPELGYSMPVAEQAVLPAEKAVALSDAIVTWDARVPDSPQDIAQTFLDLMGSIYGKLDRPEPLYHDWPGRARQTLVDLQNGEDVRVKDKGNVYLHAYLGAEYPDSMVQLSVLTALTEFAQWRGEEVPFAKDLAAGIGGFYNDEVGSVVRYLPSVGKDKNPHEVDSWYLYHPLSNLGRLAHWGHEDARKLFVDSVDYAVKVARHFKYKWPVKFDARTLEVLAEDRKPGEPGQTDAGGLYAYVMLQAWDLTENKRYIDEAKKAIDAMRARGFELAYQSNICAWGAIAALRLWLITRDDYYRDQSYVLIANFFRYSFLWDSEIGSAAHYPIFLGVTSLSDAVYMALYECFESFAAFDEYLHWGADNIRQSVQTLLAEYMKYTPSRAWFYYPSDLPEEIMAKDVRNGRIDRNLALPVEDLYADEKPAGQVGQEIYGSGAAFIFSTRAYHRPQAPFDLFCEYPLHELEATDTNRLSFRIRGTQGYGCRARIFPHGRAHADIKVIAADGSTVDVGRTPEGDLEFVAQASTRMEIRWGQSGD